MSFENLRVAALMDTAIVSGPGRQLVALAVRLRDQGVTLRVFMFQRIGRPPSPFIRYLERDGIEHVVLPDRGPLDPGVLTALAESLDEWRPDIVQTHNYRTTAMAYLLRRRRASWPWLAFFHGSTNESWKVRLYNRLDRLLLPRADQLVVMSERHRQAFAAMGSRVHVIHNAVVPIPSETAPLDLDRFRRADEGRALVGVIGRLSHEKGVDVLVEAMSRLPVGLVALVIAGDGPEREALESLTVSRGISDRVHYLGPVEDVGSLYRQLDLVVIPSRSEGLPNVLLEALQADVPVVATAVGAVPEVLTDADAGIVIPPGDPEVLAGAIRRALSVGRQASATRARAATAEQFSLQVRVQRHLQLYASLRPDRRAVRQHA